MFITAPLGIEGEICRNPIWQSGTSFVWGGVKDDRPGPEVATIDQKNREPKVFISARDIESYFDKAVPGLLVRCGLVQKNKGEAADYTITLTIRKFVAEGNKTLVKAETSAESRIVLNFDNTNDNIVVNVGYMMDSSGVGFKSKKRLEKLLSSLLKGTLEEIIESRQISFIK